SSGDQGADRRLIAGQKNARWEEVAGEGGFGCCDARSGRARRNSKRYWLSLRSVDQAGGRHALGQLGKREFFGGRVAGRAGVHTELVVREAILGIAFEILEIEFHDAHHCSFWFVQGLQQASCQSLTCFANQWLVIRLADLHAQFHRYSS